MNCQSTAINHRILTEPALRAQWLDTIVGVVADNGYDGINIDFEAVAAADRNALTSFMTELSGRLHGMGKLVSQAVSAKIRDVANHPRSTAFDYAALSQQVDWVFVMAWGIKYASSTPGAQDDIRWVKQVADYVATMPLKSKFVMGTMLYAMDWPAGGGPAAPRLGVALRRGQRPGDALRGDPGLRRRPGLDAPGLHRLATASGMTCTTPTRRWSSTGWRSLAPAASVSGSGAWARRTNACGGPPSWREAQRRLLSRACGAESDVGALAASTGLTVQSGWPGIVGVLVP